ncbi:MAG: hypothetical protein C0608_05000 [Deltaproteobacteria bacterium]|nr:MAG: hypothetical protein C0608_05000 [Deltaproteobacteria bacterium]
MKAKTQLLGKLHEDQEVHDTFLVLQKQLSPTRNGRSYLRVTLGDASGQLEARVWEGAEELSRRFEEGALVHVTGVVTSYQGVLQIKATYIEADEGKDVDWAKFLPSSKRPAEEMLAELKETLGEVQNPYLTNLLDSFMDDAEFINALSIAPAAKGMHHAYVGGLLEHTLGVVKLALMLAGSYEVNRDLLVTGAFLHDLGKMRELKSTAGFDYTLEGRFAGHIVMGRDLFLQKVASIDSFPDELRLRIEHMILSHHGELEWGSPKQPQTVEALALHMIDNLDAKLMAVIEAVEREDGQSGDYTTYLKMFSRQFYRVPVAEDKVAPSASRQEPIEDKAEESSGEPFDEFPFHEPTPEELEALQSEGDEPQRVEVPEDYVIDEDDEADFAATLAEYEKETGGGSGSSGQGSLF